MKSIVFSSCLTDMQWARIQPFLPKPAKRGRPRTDLRRVLDALCYLTSTGCQWRQLPRNFPPWRTVYHVFRRWKHEGLWLELNARLRALVRKAAGKDCRPTAGVLDSQSVKSAAHGGPVGYDAAKKIKGRKRHLLVDTLGLVSAVKVTPASTPERQGGLAVLATVLCWLRWFKKLWVDGGYSGDAFAEKAREHRPRLVVEVVKRNEVAQGFEVLPKRWVVERTFAWLMQNRRLVRDHESTESSAEAFVHIAMLRLMLNRLA